MAGKTPNDTRIQFAPHHEVIRPEVESKAIDLLGSTPYHSLGRIDCRLCDGALTLRGRVESYFLKQVAQECLIQNLDTSIRIFNQLSVD